MTQDKAARVLEYLWIEQDENTKSIQQLTKSFFERHRPSITIKDRNRIMSYIITELGWEVEG